MRLALMLSLWFLLAATSFAQNTSPDLKVFNAPGITFGPFNFSGPPTDHYTGNEYFGYRNEESSGAYRCLVVIQVQPPRIVVHNNSVCHEDYSFIGF